MRFFRWLTRCGLFVVVMVGVCWSVALLIEVVPLFDTLIDQQILRETSVAMAALKAAVPSMFVAAIVFMFHRGLCRLLRLR